MNNDTVRIPHSNYAFDIFSDKSTLEMGAVKSVVIKDSDFEEYDPYVSVK